MFQLEKAKEEIVVLKKKCEDCDQEITRLKSDLKRMSGDYGKIATRSRIVSWKIVVCTVKILKFGTPQTIATIVLKMEIFHVTLH